MEYFLVITFLQRSFQHNTINSNGTEFFLEFKLRVFLYSSVAVRIFLKLRITTSNNDCSVFGFEMEMQNVVINQLNEIFTCNVGYEVMEKNSTFFINSRPYNIRDALRIHLQKYVSK
ncbi:hypothetical protein RF11_16151 [Thelohanellus kitauei]|uniref:Uncharacterized protein n=1 Tax=Thelohanellus kitauei TaxID=669202 RepID=A0A0C2JMP4_THEKT|nr:hypothetical protein RF11_16151 [Thelohanellus kitauei]